MQSVASTCEANTIAVKLTSRIAVHSLRAILLYIIGVKWLIDEKHADNLQQYLQ